MFAAALRRRLSILSKRETAQRRVKQKLSPKVVHNYINAMREEMAQKIEEIKKMEEDEEWIACNREIDARLAELHSTYFSGAIQITPSLLDRYREERARIVDETEAKYAMQRLERDSVAAQLEARGRSERH